ncbi:hypothetical protein [Myceligenerans crystallogenes]|uniref:hypothetical protein n=1 Tax=Myceligenerans crystallogenes TaxID=316335 RepID=UPI0031D4B1EB
MSFDMPDGTFPGADEQASPGALPPGTSPGEPPVTAARGEEAAHGDPLGDALSVIDGLDGLPPGEHVARFEHVHDVLRAHLNGDA